MQATTGLTQRDRIAEQLQAIISDITDNDRREYLKAEGVTVTMLSNYLNGRVANADRGLKMLVFFRQRIAERERLINAQ